MGWIHHWLYLDYWVPTWPNAGAIPLCVAFGAIGTYCFRRPLGRLWKRVKADMHRDVRDDISDIRAIAEAGRRIAADTHKHVTGRDHPDAPA